MDCANPPRNTVRTKHPFRQDIEGLRAIAVSGVVAFHLGMSGIPGGFVGVDIFFVISGYLITQQLQREIGERGSIDLWAFYARRARRLLPASLLVIVATLACGYAILAPSEQQLYGKAGFFAAAYSINLWLIRWAFDYFAPNAANNPFLHFWSLSVEEQFYVAWPALLLLASWLPARHRTATTMALVAAVSFGLCVWITAKSQPWAFYFTPLRAWEFALGGLASSMVARKRVGWPRLYPAASWFGLTLIVIAYFSISEGDPFPGMAAILPVSGAALVLWGGQRESAWSPTTLLRLPPFQWIGRLSYSIYLWHWPIIVYAAVLKTDLTIADRLLCLVLTIVLAAISYQFVENPVRRNRRLAAHTGMTIALALAFTGTGAAIGYGNAELASRNELLPGQQRVMRTAETPSISAASDCLVSLEDSRPRSCVFGDRASKRTIVLFGDSHADHWSTPLAAIAKRRGFRLITFLKASCSPVAVTTWSVRLKRRFVECDEWRKAALKQIAEIGPSVVVISQFTNSYVDNSINGDGSHTVSEAEWIEGLQTTVRYLGDRGIDVVVVRDGPFHSHYIDQCVARALWRGIATASCATLEAEAFDERITDAERAAIANLPNARYADLTAQFCHDRVCPGLINGVLAFRDRQHMTTDFAATLAGPLAHAIFPSDDTPGSAEWVDKQAGRKKASGL